MGRFGTSRFGQSRFGEATPTQVRPGQEALDLVEPAAFIGTGSWFVAGTRVDVLDLAVSPTEFQLTVRTQIHEEAEAIRELNSQAGEVERLPLAGGGWTTVDRSEGSGNTVAVSPPDGLRPPLKPAEYHVDRYDERAVSSDGRVINVNLGLVRTEPREIDDTLPTPSAASDEWLLEFDAGRIATPNVSRADQGRQADIDLRVTLDDDEVEVLLEDATRPDSVTVRDVPDGDDFVAAGARQQVTISLPASGTPSEHLPTDGGDYAIREWQVRREDPVRWLARLTVRELP
jgi:hypothetical protein